MSHIAIACVHYVSITLDCTSWWENFSILSFSYSCVCIGDGVCYYQVLTLIPLYVLSFSLNILTFVILLVVTRDRILPSNSILLQPIIRILQVFSSVIYSVPKVII